MWKRSWLSREVLLFTLFAGASSAYVGALWVGSDLAIGAGVAASCPNVAATVSNIDATAPSGCFQHAARNSPEFVEGLPN